jgi:hypothetical protein
LETLKEELNSDKISRMRPFGKALQYSLENARIDVENRDYALWIEEDYWKIIVLHLWQWRERLCLTDTSMISP